MAAARALVTFIKHELADSHVPEVIRRPELKYLKNLSALAASCKLAHAELQPTLIERSRRDFEMCHGPKRERLHEKYTFALLKVGDVVSFQKFHGGGANTTYKHVTVVRKTATTFSVMVNGNRRPRTFYRAAVVTFYMSPPTEPTSVESYWPSHDRDR
jgi:hypothetical protein